MKKKIFIIAVAACLLALTIAGSSLAYFTDTEEYTNVFTAGHVEIELTCEGNEISTGNGIALGYHVYPGQSYDFNATIANIGSEDAYVGAIITLTSTQLDAFVSIEGENDNYPVAVRKLLTDLAADYDNNEYIVKYTTDTNVITIYIINERPLNAVENGVNDACIFWESITIPTEWDHDEIEAFTSLNIKVVAYATQTEGFDDATDAITTAFATQWSAYASADDLG